MSAYALFKVGDIWHFRFQIDGRRTQRSTREVTRRRAQEVAERAYEAALARSRGDEPCPTLSELVVLWVDAHQQTSSAAHLRSLETFGRCHLYDLADLLICDLTTAAVEEARARHLEDHAPASANHWLANLSLLVNWAKRRRMIREKSWEVRPLKVQKKPRVQLPLGAVQRYLRKFDQTCAPGLRTAVRLAIGMGLREMEALRARFEWIDWERKTYTPGETKGREAKPMPIPGWLFDYLKGLPNRRGWVCPRGDGRPYAEGRLREAMKQVNRATKMPNLTPHRLRGTYATALLEAGVPLPDVQQALRHKDIKTTLAYTETDMRRVARGQDEIAARSKMIRRESGEPRPGGVR